MRLRFFTISCLLAATLAATFASVGSAVAQDEPDPAELEKQYARLRYQSFSRHASAVYDTVLRFAQMDQSRLTPGDEFVRAYFESRWDEVRETLAKLPDKFADEAYTKMLADLTGQNAPLFTLDDFIGLSDACPSELSSDRIRRLGLLLRIAVAKEQQLWLKQALKKGTRFFGEKGEKRLNAGRVLMHADFDELARQYLPSAIEATQLDDSSARGEILRYLESQDELEEFQHTQIAELWKQRASVLKDPGAESRAKWLAAERLAELVGKVPTPATGSGGVGPWIRNLVESDLDAALQLASSLGTRAHGKLNDRNVATRVNNLRVQRLLLGHVARHTDLAQPPWSPVAMAMANCWISEAEHTFLVRPGYPANRKYHVAPGELLDSVPEGDWAKAIPTSLAERIDVCRLKIVMLSDHYQDAAAMIVEIAGDNPEAGIALAEQYLKAWADRHNPEIPEAIRKKHGLSQDARIMVTPLMMEKNIASLAEIMDIFRRNGISPRNAELLVAAFDVCYSNAEVYRKTHVEKVFGRIDEMDEDVFFHMIRTMTQGLSSRWRKMEVQQASGTRRSQKETLDMVRTGYQTAIDMIGRRSQKHPDSWKSPMAAGSLMSDWGDFEYYQQLSGDTSTNRMEAFREKNNRAEEYFTRAAEVYAGLVPQLDRGRYSIDVYLAWFHSLLGINTSGTLNLSKPLDRRVLGRLRQSIRGLPDGAGSTHVDRFAKHVSARMEDTTDPLHKELKYKYLAGSLVITKESPFSFQAGEKVAYYDELLDEVRLQTRVDGPNTIHRNHAFGIVLSVQHTEALGRMADFGKYLINEVPRRSTPAANQTATYRTANVQGRRNELEMNIQEALALFFDVKSIVFSPADVQPRATDRPGWEETVLAYVYVKAKDSSVDKIPRIQMNLEFLDMAGPVTISAESAETMIKVTDKSTPPRPFSRVEMALTLDVRNLADTEEVQIEVTATACGLLPELEELLDLDALGRQLPIARSDPSGDMLVRQLNSWGDTVHVVSERQWSIALDASSLLQNEQSMELRLPAAKVDGTAITYRTYVDMDLVDLETAAGAAANGNGPVTTIGAGPLSRDTAAVVASIDPRILYGAAAGTVVLVLLVAIVVAGLLRGPRRRKLRARDVFCVPPKLDGFVVVQLLKALDNSELVRMTDARRSEMQQEIRRIETTCFGNNGSGLADEELRRVARKWLKIAC